MSSLPHNLGRIEVPDERDRMFLLADALPPAAAEDLPEYKYWWASGWWGNQGSLPHCVAYSWLHWVEDGPVTHFYEGRDTRPMLNPKGLYDACQLVDQWPGENYDGTSVRAGAKMLAQHGVIKEYRWAWDIDTALRALRSAGPLVVGTWWYMDMFYPDSKGFIRPTGDKAGGHAYVINGVNMNKGFVRIKNSWGRDWGRRGYAYMKIDDFASLIESGGEVCMAVEKKLDQ
jgi:hypothetical protein